MPSGLCVTVVDSGAAEGLVGGFECWPQRTGLGGGEIGLYLGVRVRVINRVRGAAPLSTTVKRSPLGIARQVSQP